MFGERRNTDNGELVKVSFSFMQLSHQRIKKR